MFCSWSIYSKDVQVQNFESGPPLHQSTRGQDSCPCSNEDPSNEVSIIEPSIPAPILVTDASIEDFQRCLPKSAGSKPTSPRAFPPPDAPQSDVEELYFNTGARSNVSVLEKSAGHQENNQSLDTERKCGTFDRKSAVHSTPLCKIVQQSGGGSSAGEVDPGAGWDAESRAQYYHNQLLSTLKVLENREETVRVQDESLRVAEARIAALTTRVDRLRAQIDQQAAELRSLRVADKSRAERADAATAEAQDSQQQKVVRCLQTNLAIIEDLYRECFYETVKQEELIEILRESYLEDKRPRHPTRSPQDIAKEVDSLKMDISNFLNNSNSDSGVWERGGEGGGGEAEWGWLGAELQHITGQLLRLRNMLAVDCTCGLEEENMRLKNANETLEIQLSETRQKLSELESALAAKGEPDQYKKEVEAKSQELHNIIEQMAKLEETIAKKNAECEIFSKQLQQSQVSLEEQSQQLCEWQQRVASLEGAVRVLKDDLKLANERAEQSRVECEETRGREAATAAELTRARHHASRLDRTYREQTQTALVLQEQLQEAHLRGAALCRDVRAVVAAVHDWLRRHRNREDKLKEQETIIKSLQHSLEMYQKDDIVKERDDTEVCCPKCVRRRNRTFGSGTASCSRWKSNEEKRRHVCSYTSGSEMASPSSVPTPPQRLKKEKHFPCAVTEWRRRDAAERQRRALDDIDLIFERSLSPSSLVRQRTSALLAAIDHAQPRWAHTR